MKLLNIEWDITNSHQLRYSSPFFASFFFILCIRFHKIRLQLKRLKYQISKYSMRITIEIKKKYFSLFPLVSHELRLYLEPFRVLLHERFLNVIVILLIYFRSVDLQGLVHRNESNITLFVYLFDHALYHLMFICVGKHPNWPLSFLKIFWKGFEQLNI